MRTVSTEVVSESIVYWSEWMVHYSEVWGGLCNVEVGGGC